jgi:glycine cleavage system H protein
VATLAGKGSAAWLPRPRGEPAARSASVRAMHFPEDLRYSDDHEWARIEDGDDGPMVRVGITEYAQDALGDVVFVGLPEVGTSVGRGATCGEVESTKSVSEIYAPVAGTVLAVNGDLVDAPERLNEDPYGEGWIYVLRPDDADDLDSMLDAGAYQALVDGSG